MPKISALPIANSATTGDLLVLDQGSITKRIDFNVLQSAVANAGTVKSMIGIGGGSPSFDTVNAQILALGGVVSPQVRFSPLSGASKTGQIYQSGDALFIAAFGVTNLISLNLSGGQFYPANDTGVGQTAAGIFAGTGVPSNARGNNGDFYLRADGGLGSTIFTKRGGTWIGIA